MENFTKMPSRYADRAEVWEVCAGSIGIRAKHDSNDRSLPPVTGERWIDFIRALREIWKRPMSRLWWAVGEFS